MFNMQNSYDTIRRVCTEADCIDPVLLANQLMRTDSIRPHGPEHHYLTAAALCASWCNATGEPKQGHLDHLQARCKQIQPGVCGYFGVCGDVMAAGAAFSEMLEVNYLSGKRWHDIAAFTAGVLKAVADSCVGGPRCCKRTTFAVLSAAVKWLGEKNVVMLGVPNEIHCSFSDRNTQCIRKGCIYYG